jgi:hypothetical protein
MSIQDCPLELPSTQHKIAYRVDPKSLLSSYRAHLQQRGQRATEHDSARTTKRLLGEVAVEG